MKRFTFILVLLAAMLLIASGALAQDMAERIYPSQYADLDAYMAGGGGQH